MLQECGTVVLASVEAPAVLGGSGTRLVNRVVSCR